MTESGEQTSIHLTVEQLEKHHRIAMRRQRAIHALQRFYVNSTTYRKRQIDDRIQDRCEKRARLVAALSHIQNGNTESGSELLLPSEDPSPISIRNTISTLDVELIGLVKSQKALGNVMQMDGERKAVLRSLQAAEEYRLTNTIAAEVKGPVNGKFAIDLRASNIPKASQTKSDTPVGGVTEEDGDGRDTEGMEDATEEEEVEETEGALTLTDAQIAARDKRRQKEKDRKRRTPEEIFRAKERAWAARYTGIVPCERCGCHSARQEIRSCDDCGRNLCNRGGKGDGHPVAAFCIIVAVCNCGSTQCYDCLTDESGRKGGGSMSWKRCSVGDSCSAPESGAADDYEVASWMCDKEQSNKGSTCQNCGLFPICRKCRSSHEKECGYGTVERDFTSDSDNEIDE